MQINVTGYPISDAEIEAYRKRGIEKYGDRLVGIDINIIDKETVDLTYHILLIDFLNNRPFERIRRITGYLVGTVERFNDAKRAEERDRVKHGVDYE